AGGAGAAPTGDSRDGACRRAAQSLVAPSRQRSTGRATAASSDTSGRWQERCAARARGHRPLVTDGRRPGGTHMSGRVVFVGAGPGALDLLTLRAVRTLQECDVVLHDELVPHDFVSLLRPGTTVINVGKRCGQVGMT